MDMDMDTKDYVVLRLYRQDVRNSFPEVTLSDERCDELLKYLQELHEIEGIITESMMREIFGGLA